MKPVVIGGVVAAAVIAAFAFGMFGSDEMAEGPAEEVGEQLDQAADDVGDAVEGAADDAEAAVDDATN